MNIQHLTFNSQRPRLKTKARQSREPETADERRSTQILITEGNEGNGLIKNVHREVRAAPAYTKYAKDEQFGEDLEGPSRAGHLGTTWKSSLPRQPNSFSARRRK
jgi:hypothetical protein